jgi:hypothetical protein
MEDWVKDHVVLKQRFNFKITSPKRIKELHRVMSYQRAVKQMVAFNTDKKYLGVLDTIDPAVKAELINSKSRILEESRAMYHCVATYASKVKTGQSAIYHLDYAEQPWTLELIEEGGIIYPIQLRGKYKASSPPELNRYVKEAVDAHNTKVIEKLRNARVDKAPEREYVAEDHLLAQEV